MSLPERWKMLPFMGCLKKVKSKKKPSIPKKDYQESGKFPVIDQGASFIAGWTDSVESVIFDNLPIIIFGDHTRIFKYVDFPFAIGAQGTQILYPNDDILDPHFFYYALLGLKIPNKGYNRHYRYLREFSIPCPPLPEQRAIAHVLQTIQEAKTARQREIALERERKAALMDYLFSHGTKGEPRQQTEIGEIPESWEVVPLEKVASVLNKKRVPLNQAQRRHMQGEYPYCGANGIVDYIDDYIFDGEHVLLAEDGGSWGPFEDSAYLMKGKFWVNNHAHVLQAKRSVSDNYFLMCQLNYLDINRFIRGTTRGKLNQGVMREIPVSLPPFPEQGIIAETLQDCDNKVAALEQEVKHIDELFHAMLDELMTGQRSAVPLIDTELL